MYLAGEPLNLKINSPKENTCLRENSSATVVEPGYIYQKSENQGNVSWRWDAVLWKKKEKKIAAADCRNWDLWDSIKFVNLTPGTWCRRDPLNLHHQTLDKKSLSRRFCSCCLLLYKQEIISWRLYFPLSYASGCCFVIKMGDAGLEACSHWEPCGTGRPISVCERMSCSLGVCFGSCQPLPSVFIFLLSFLLSSAHPFRPSKFCSLSYGILCRRRICREQTGVGMLSPLVFDTEDTPEFCRRSAFC